MKSIVRVGAAAAALCMVGALAAPGVATADARVGPGDQTLRCESNDAREQFCAASIGGSVRVVRELSRAPCVQGRTWRYTRDGIYVREGCRAEFAFQPAGGSGGWGGSGGSGGGGWGDSGGTRRVSCASTGGREHFCPAPNDGRVRLVASSGSNRCVEGQTWRHSEQGVTVRANCTGVFEYHERSGGGGGWGGSGGSWGGGQAETFSVKCESRNHRWAACPAEIVGNVRLAKQESHAQCVKNWTWGTLGREAIWVSDGCRGRFEVNGRPSTQPVRGGDGYAPPGVQRVQPR